MSSQHYKPGPQSESLNFCLVPFFQLLLKICFPESPPESASDAPDLMSVRVQDFQQLHMDFPNLINIRTSSKGKKKSPNSYEHIQEPPGVWTPQCERCCLKKPKSNFKNNAFQMQMRIATKKISLYNWENIEAHCKHSHRI